MRKLFVLFVLGSLSLAVGCGGSGGGSTPKGVPTGSSGANVLDITVDGGPTATQAGGNLYVNGVFASATICSPGSTTNCVTVDHLLVDTGSFGVRVLESEVASLNLPTVAGADGTTAYDCVSFADSSFLWGPVEAADVTLSGEVAGSVPIHIISSSNANIPTSCSTGNSAGNENTQALLGANGILGVGLEPLDCGGACDPSAGVLPQGDPYYSCATIPCVQTLVPEANQVTNPVVFFPTDNNGVIVELPSVSGSAPSVNGSLIFGIGTEANNQLPSSAQVFTVACSDYFNTIFQNTTYGIVDVNNCADAANQGSFIDSGSNALFFPDSSLPACTSSDPTDPITSFYCPATLTPLSATNQDPNDLSIQKATSFSVDNAINLFSTNNAADSTLGGLPAAGLGFDWGLPFFYGKNVYSSIDGMGVPSNLPAPPWWAY